MTFQLRFRSCCWLACLAFATVYCGWLNDVAHAAITWDSQTLGDDPDTPEVEMDPQGAGTQWWFDPVNWSPTNPGEAVPWFLPPTTDGTSTTDIQINEGTMSLPGGEGVVYDPDNDPHYADLDLGGPQTLGAEDLTYPTGYGPKMVERIYLSRNTTEHNLLTIKGDLEVRRSGTQAVIVGRSGSSTGNENLGRINQISGNVLINGDLDIAGTENGTLPGWGNGIYDYRGGTLEVGPNTVTEIRLSAGSSGAGAAGRGTLIIHNPDTGGYIRARELQSAVSTGEGSPTGFMVADGVHLGVGVLEFHYENGGTRPLQIRENLVLNNGSNAGNASTRSSLLDLKLAEAPCAGDSCVPNDIGLVDVSFMNGDFGLIIGSLSRGATFSKIDNPDHVYTEGSTVSAKFGATRYDWQISYTGDISWLNGGINSEIDQILGSGNGTDVVLIGLGSEVVGLAGDFNDDMKVDAADYTVWRDNLGAGDESSINDNGDGMNGVDIGDYNLWKTNFGMMVGSGALAAGAVPEPATALMCLAGALGMLGLRRRIR